MAEWQVMLNDRVLDSFWVEEGDKVNVGRGQDVDVRIDNSAVSREHVMFEMQDGKMLLTDLGSTNGTSVNGSKIKGTVSVKRSDRIEIGKFRFALARTAEGGLPPFAMLRDPLRASSRPRPGDLEETLFIAPHRLALVEGKATPQRLPLKGKNTVTLGKDDSCDVRIPGRLIGKTQCQIVAKNGQYYLVHREGLRGTTVNGRKIRGEHKLRRGDMIGIGGSKLRFQ